ncbi:alpha/beta hydrolase [Streptomyces sp. SID3343]|uniref:alpha/beta fold hydrolase n=1 Tax=Streptomyces sp. SID3343 TaxID=2690260 RepID=UPI00136C1426|nr:alpha/beta hydrolase [Streptomyces sp. SID3343]MYW05798.1 alpha/beta fold hydrolase [Streptomyces sp. SID3343]
MITTTLSAPGAEIHYEVRGTGPALILIHGGAGDAAMFGPAAELLCDRYTVVTYDRRGNSRSHLTEPAEEQRVVEHSEDVRLLLNAIEVESAYIFGGHTGAVIGLDLLARHPAQVTKLVAHEPPVLELLPDAERLRAQIQEVRDICRRDGTEQAIRKLAAVIRVPGPPPNHPSLPAPVREMLARIEGNVEYSLLHELRPFTSFSPGVEALRGAALTLAGGTEGRDTLPYLATTALADVLGTSLVEFPGDHVSYARYPAEFADILTGLLAT